MSLSVLLNVFRRNARAKSRRKLLSTAALVVESVEERILLSSENGLPLFNTSGSPGPTGNANPLTAIPRLNSNAGAPVTFYLDFDGHTETDPSWTSNGSIAVVTPVYDNDSDLTTFSDDELRRIEEIWYRVAEDYFPFNVNVTTIEPATLNDFEGIRISIGGAGTWRPTPSGGVAYLDAFSNSGRSNTCFVFTDNLQDALGNGAVVPTAMNASHEAGHTLGLNHHSEFDANGSKVQEYDPGNTRLGPIMGGAFYSERNIWVNGPANTTVDVLQDDVATMIRAQNQTFHLRTDDYGNTFSTAFPIISNGSSVIRSGVIEQETDIDMFRFESNTGPISFSVQGLNLQTVYSDNTLNFGTNLDTTLRLYNAAGSLLATSDSATSLFSSVSATVTSGVYYIAVSSTGEYGSIGQYTLSGSIIPLPSTPTMVGPVGALTQPVPTFEWTVGANADHYELEVDNLTTNDTGYYTRDVIGLTHTAVNQFLEGDYQARVRTVAADGSLSAWSNYVTFSIDIPTPAKPRITRPTGDIADSFPTFAWTGDEFSRTYSLWVTAVVPNTRVINRTAYAGTSYVHFDPLPDGTYRAWVKATNSVGETSAWSDFVEFTIDAPSPLAPRITAPIPVTTSTSPRIIWTAVNSAARYDLFVNNLTTGTGQYIRQENISYKTTYYDTSGLPQGTFKVWVRAANGNNEYSPWSTPYTFTVDILPPGTPKILGPTGPIVSQTITTTNPTFKWTAADRAVKYDLWVNNVTTGQAQIIRQQNLTGTQYVALNNLPQGDYRAFVRGINSAGEVGEWSTVFIFNLDEPTPSIPVITAPVSNPAGSVENPNPTFAWTAEFDAPLYEFRLDDQTLKKTSVISVTNISGKTYTIPNNQRLSEHSYVAMVRAVNNSGEKSNWSAPYLIRIDVPNPTTPSIIGPSNTSKDRTPTFEWNHDKGSRSYEILVRDLERSETIVLQVKTLSLDPTGKIAFYTLPDSMAFKPGTYRFWIRAFSSIGTASSWSASQTFVISASLNLKDLKIVEPAKLQAAEVLYAAEHYAQPAAEPFDGIVFDVAQTVTPTERTLLPVSDNSMPVAMIEVVMESFADPSSTASAMLSASLSDDRQAASQKVTTAAASLFALTLMPRRRTRSEE